MEIAVDLSRVWQLEVLLPYQHLALQKTCKPEMENAEEAQGVASGAGGKRFFCGHLEDPIPVADLVKEFHAGYVSKDVKYNFSSFKQDGIKVNTVKDEKRLIGNIVEGSQLGKRVDYIGGELMKRLEGEGGSGIPLYAKGELELRQENMAKTVLITQYGAGRQANHRDHGAYGVLFVMSDCYQFRAYPGSHLAANKSRVASIESITLHLPAKSVIVFNGKLIHGAVEYVSSDWARLSAHLYVDKKGVPMPEDTTWPVKGTFGLDVSITPVDSRLLLQTPPPQPYWLTALFAEKEFSAACPQGCHAVGPELEARLTLRNVTRGDTAFGRVVVHEKHTTLFWIAGCPVKPRGARAGNGLWVYDPWEVAPVEDAWGHGPPNRRLVLFRAGCLNNKTPTLNKSLSVEADREDLGTLLLEAVAALEKGVRGLAIAPVEALKHHTKSCEGKFEGELQPLPLSAPAEPPLNKRKAQSPPAPPASLRPRLPRGAPPASAPKAPPASAPKAPPPPLPPRDPRVSLVRSSVRPVRHPSRRSVEFGRVDFR
ncbi:hypothetical protein CYMTET_10354 [Cymbomonas tetramitiformis]|uniref:Uncharacterized protein n=1 Tax=Cymbomonas tetramitiformis TaxID=36881 RepID=A0AAE0LEJ1_9CHLO|nr:hypothetical protein CYMTET_10354 [Cymbomonas tetramitiformis]